MLHGPRFHLWLSVLLLGLSHGIATLRAAEAARFSLTDGDRVLFIGDTFFEREFDYGHLETALTTAYADRRITFRNLAWAGDTPMGKARASFDWNKSDITPEAASILDNAFSNYQNCGNAKVMLAGHADRSGSASYNVGLSQRRADSVKAYFTGKGVPTGVITTEAFGESRPRVQTADGVRELQNRRVEITYGPGSGM